MNRRIYGQWQNNVPSRFLNEIPTDCVKIINSVNRQYTGGYQNFGSYNKKQNFSSDKYSDYSYEPDEEYSSASNKRLKGVRVYHQSFGYGTILSVEGQKCEVFFDKAGRKKIMGNFLRRV